MIFLYLLCFAIMPKKLNYVLYIFFVFVVFIISGCGTIRDEEFVGTGTWTDISTEQSADVYRSDNLSNIYIDNAVNILQNWESWEIIDIYTDGSFVINNILQFTSGYQVSEWLQVIEKWNNLLVSGNVAGSIYFDISRDGILKFEQKDIMINKWSFQINIYWYKILAGIDVFGDSNKKIKMDSRNVSMYDQNMNIMPTIYIPKNTDISFVANRAMNADWSSGDLKFIKVVNLKWINNKNVSGDIKLSDWLKLQKINFYNYNKLESLNSLYISPNSRDVKYQYSGDKIIFDYNRYMNGEAIIMIDDNLNVYIQPIEIADLKVDFEFWSENAYNININSNYNIQQDLLKTELNRILGKWSYDLNGDGRYMYINYRPIPGKLYSGDLIVNDYFGNKVSKNINIKVDKLISQFVRSEVAGNTFNILPTTWSYNQIFVNYQNKRSFDYRISTCNLDTSKIASISWDYKYDKWYTMENYIFDCAGGSVYTGKFTNDKFEYWKTYTAKIDIPQSMRAAKYYRFEILSDSGTISTGTNYDYFTSYQQVAHFARSNIWITTKTTSWYIYIWVNYLDSGKFANSGNVYIQDLVNSKAPAKTYALTGEFIIVSSSGNNPKLLTFDDGTWNNGLVIVWWDNYGYYNNLNINSYISSWELLDNKYRYGSDTDIKIYWYTDRWLYKIWEDMYFNGFVRNNNNKSIPQWQVIITVVNPIDGSIIYTSSWIKLDEFGWFKWSYYINKWAKLWDYFVNYQFGDSTNSANIKILEYQKPTFAADIDYKTIAWWYSVTIDPKYYFGEKLKDYDITTDISIQWQNNDYWRNYDNYYYNVDPNYSMNLTRSYKASNQTGAYIVNFTWDVNVPIEANIYINTKIFDNKSNEKQTFAKYIDIQPNILIWLPGSYYDWTENDNINVEWILSGKSEYISDINNKYNLTYDIYYRDWSQSLYNGVDGNLYYTMDGAYISVWSGVLDVKNGKFIVNQKIEKAGDYIVKISAKDNQGNIYGINTKHINYYDWNDNSAMQWLMPNNYQMAVNAQDKIYEIWEKVKLNLSPYIKWSKLIVTVERNDKILDTYSVDMNGSDIYIPIKKWYEPNVNISVVQIAGSDIFTSVRKEPKFLMAMTNIDVDPDSNILNIDITTDKKEYKPWETVKMAIKTTDHNNKPVMARVSVAVVDKSLNDLYSYIKEPLEYFYRKTTSWVGNYSSLKLLYLSLRSFIDNGSKGWWWSGPTSFGAIRSDLSDLAFWRSAIYTTWWVANISFTLPDNLTTRQTEVIWITKDTKLWVAKNEIISSKDLIVEPNMPLFMTIGDQLVIPTKVLLGSKHKIDDSKMANVSAKLILSGQEINLINVQMPVNKMALLPIKIPYDLYNLDSASIYISASYDGLTDAVITKMPIRSDGFVLRNLYNQPSSKNGKINIKNDSINGNININISKLPTFDINNIVRYLIYYPYGCTEQVASSIMPILLVKTIDSRLVSSDILSGNILYINHVEYNINTIITEWVNKMLNNQRDDGGFDYRPWKTNSYYYLSAYMYGVLSMVQNNKLATNIDLKPYISKLEKYLETNKNTDVNSYMYYIYYKSNAGIPINKDTINTLQKLADSKTGTVSSKVLLNYISTNNGGAMIYNIDTKSLDSYVLDKWYSYNNFLDKYILASMQLRSLINSKWSSQDIYNIYKYIIDGKWEIYGWLRSWSNQTNVNVLFALAEYSKYIMNGSKDVSCTVNYGSGDMKLLLNQNNINNKYNLTYSGSMSRDISWSCDDNVLVNIEDEYIYTDIAKNRIKNQWIRNFKLSYNDNVKIGEEVNFEWIFELDSNANQLAVEYFIPSSTKLLYSIDSKNKSDNSSNMYYYGEDLPFDYGNKRECRPNHWEVRFDRLFLYYDKLEKWTSCKISIKWIKAYNGKVNLQPSKIREMYDSKVNWVYIKN